VFPSLLNRYQAQGSFDEFWKEVVDKDKKRPSGPRKKLLGDQGSDSKHVTKTDSWKNNRKRRKNEKSKSVNDSEVSEKGAADSKNMDTT